MSETEDPAQQTRISCPLCGRLGQIDPLVTLAAAGSDVTCSNCGESMSAWDALWKSIELDHFGLVALSLGGAMWNVAQVPLRANERNVFTAGDLGLDDDAEVLNVFWTPQGGAIFPAVLVASRLPYTRIPLPLVLYGVPFEGASETTRLALQVHWIPSGQSDVEATQLVQAGVQYIDAATQPLASYEAVVLSAQIALELAVTRLVDELLSETTGRERRENFIDEIGYAHLLSVVLPALAQSRFGEDAAMPERVYASAQRLRKARNKLAHEGSVSGGIERSEAAQLLAAAAVGVRYCRILQTRRAARAERPST